MNRKRFPIGRKERKRTTMTMTSEWATATAINKNGRHRKLLPTKRCQHNEFNVYQFLWQTVISKLYLFAAFGQNWKIQTIGKKPNQRRNKIENRTRKNGREALGRVWTGRRMSTKNILDSIIRPQLTRHASTIRNV